MSHSVIDGTKIVITTLQKFPFVLVSLTVAVARARRRRREEKKQAKEWSLIAKMCYLSMRRIQPDWGIARELTATRRGNHGRRRREADWEHC